MNIDFSNQSKSHHSKEYYSLKHKTETTYNELNQLIQSNQYNIRWLHDFLPSQSSFTEQFNKHYDDPFRLFHNERFYLNKEPTDSIPLTNCAIVILLCEKLTYLDEVLDTLSHQSTYSHYHLFLSLGCDSLHDSMLTKYQSKPYSIKEILHVPEEYQQSTLSITQRITLHYYYLFHYFYDLHAYDNVIFLEDDLSVSPDFLNYFETLYPVLISDPSLWCISAWNDNALSYNQKSTDYAIHIQRTSFFPGLGWLMNRSVYFMIKSELIPQPSSGWDNLFRILPSLQDRECLFPLLPRTFHHLSKKSSHELGREAKLYSHYPLSSSTILDYGDLSYVLLENYEQSILYNLQQAQQLSIHQYQRKSYYQQAHLYLIYFTDSDYYELATYFHLFSKQFRGFHHYLLSFTFQSSTIYLIHSQLSPYAPLKATDFHSIVLPSYIDTSCTTMCSQFTNEMNSLLSSPPARSYSFSCQSDASVYLHSCSTLQQFFTCDLGCDYGVGETIPASEYSFHDILPFLNRQYQRPSLKSLLSTPNTSSLYHSNNKCYVNRENHPSQCNLESDKQQRLCICTIS